MNKKRIIGLIALAAGIFLICYAVHSFNKIAQAKGFESDVNNFFNHNPSVWNPLIEFFGGKAQEEVSQYDLPVTIMMLSGIALTIGGAITLIIWCKKKPKT
ncbi:MAG: hypothetical protein JSR93_06815 [Verrucomicrobia bacterium]|nr:hypothetical protein [Verrucomicrobiota bacterium]